MNMLARMLGEVNNTSKRNIQLEVLAQIKESGADLKVLTDPSSFSTLMKLYQKFIDDTDLRGLPNFLMEVDQMLQDFGGRPRPAQPKQEETHENAVTDED